MKSFGALCCFVCRFTFNHAQSLGNVVPDKCKYNLTAVDIGRVDVREDAFMGKKFHYVLKGLGLVGLLSQTFFAGFGGSGEVVAAGTTSGGCEEAPVITDISRLGTITHYNGIIFGDFYAEKADVEGSLAVGGNSRVGTAGSGFCFGAAYDAGGAQAIGTFSNPNNYPTFLSGGMPYFVGGTWGTHFNVFGGPMVVSDAVKSQFCQQVQVTSNSIHFNNNANAWLRGTPGFAFAHSSAVDSFFANARLQSVTLSNTLSVGQNRPGASISLADFRWPNAAFSDVTTFIPDSIAGISNLLIINVLDSGHIDVFDPHLTAGFLSYDLVVFNFPYATAATFRSGVMIDNQIMGSLNPQLFAYAERLLWNFPIATAIHGQHHDFIGSVIAPHAHFQANGGSVNGMLIANQFTTVGGHELHAFRPILRDRIFDARPIEPEMTEPMTTVPVTTVPVTTVPVTTAPVTTVPSTTVPVTTAPATTVPVTTVPTTTIPITTAPATTVPVTTVPVTTVPVTTVPATTIPMTTAPATTIPATTVPVTTAPVTTTPITTVPATTIPSTSLPTDPRPTETTPNSSVPVSSAPSEPTSSTPITTESQSTEPTSSTVVTDEDETFWYVNPETNWPVFNPENRVVLPSSPIVLPEHVTTVPTPSDDVELEVISESNDVLITNSTSTDIPITPVIHQPTLPQTGTHLLNVLPMGGLVIGAGVAVAKTKKEK